MYNPETFVAAFGLMVLSMLCWGLVSVVCLGVPETKGRSLEKSRITGPITVCNISKVFLHPPNND